MTIRSGLKSRLEDYNLRLWMLTFLGVAVQVLLLVPTLPYVSQFLAVYGKPGFQFNTEENILSFAYFIAPLAYCIGASLSFRPKRIVSPLNIQLGAAAVYSLLVFYSLATSGLNLSTTEVLNDTYIVLILTAGLGTILGFAQTWVVKTLAGLNLDIGNFDQGNDCPRKSFLIPASFERVANVLSNETLRNVWEFRKAIKSKGDIVLRSWNTSSYQQVIVARELNSTETIVGTFAYEKDFYSVYPSKVASLSRDRVIRDICDELKVESQRLISIEPTSEALKATRMGLAPTKSIFDHLEDISRFHIGIIFLSLLVLASIVVLYIYNPNPFYEESIVATLVALVIELAPSIKEYAEKRSAEQE